MGSHEKTVRLRPTFRVVPLTPIPNPQSLTCILTHLPGSPSGFPIGLSGILSIGVSDEEVRAMGKTFDEGKDEICQPVPVLLPSTTTRFFAPGVKEADIRQSLIDPLFEALGWDVRNAARSLRNIGK